MELKEIGEFGLISDIKKKFENMIPNGVEGIGDDCAIIPKDENSSYVITTDMLVENIHFLMEKISAYQLGYKSLAVNISDIASMGATPCFSFLSFALSPTISSEWCREYIEGYHSLSSKYNIPLLGGDTTATVEHSATISITAIGEVLNSNIKRRSGAKVGDIIAVTSTLGESAAALRQILSDEDCPLILKNRHNMPRPHIGEGKYLGANPYVHAMMDISDGVSSDIRHICKLSGVGAIIYTESIPHSFELLELSKLKKWNILDLSLSGGEDYSLLLTIDKNKFTSVKDGLKASCDTVLYQIGEVTSQSNGIKYIDSLGSEVKLVVGFEHF